MPVVLIIKVDPLISGPRAAHHGDEPGSVGTLTGVGGLVLMPATHSLQQGTHEPTCIHTQAEVGPLSVTFLITWGKSVLNTMRL